MNKNYKPLPDNIRLGFSNIHDIGLFAKELIPQGTNLGMTHFKIGELLIRTPMGGFINHSYKPNCIKAKKKLTHYKFIPYPLSEDTIKYISTKWNLVTLEDIKQGKELTIKYTFYNLDEKEGGLNDNNNNNCSTIF